MVSIYIVKFLPFNMPVSCAPAKPDLVSCSKAFEKKYGSDRDVVITSSAKSELEKNDIKGPSIFKKDKAAGLVRLKQNNQLVLSTLAAYDSIFKENK
ncbi:MAG: hypothetical protein JXR76_06720 [Deltaproteobacteria bacterium]|nr:hypothetical protein [Deltaproteobacteria bacterium]